MKRLSLYCTLVLFVAIFSSCSNSSNPTAQMLQDEPAMTAPISNVSLITLPQSSTPRALAKTSKDGVWITPDKGGDVPASDTYTSASGTIVTVTMNLHFEPGTVSHPTLISIALDSRTLVADFSPNGIVFNKPATLSATVTGLDFSIFPSNMKVGLFYINGDSYELMPGTVAVDRKAQTLSITDGQIPHFSLYGFGYTK